LFFLILTFIVPGDTRGSPHPSPITSTLYSVPYSPTVSQVFPFLSILFVKVVPVLLWCHPRFFNQLAEKSGTKGLIGMNRNREMDGTSLFYQDLVAPLNRVHDPSCPFEGGDMPVSPRPGEFRHN